ncbi:MAG: hypothetical protein C4527_02090 [Candidatus Omnitrophota bacterium]|nr:MAG: hypothetical protein C4527_02090 [Candidatus Omnitrophota bacterium]
MIPPLLLIYTKYPLQEPKIYGFMKDVVTQSNPFQLESTHELNDVWREKLIIVLSRLSICMFQPQAMLAMVKALLSPSMAL